ncbi:MAG: trimeric intracellular cation channel family protein [Bacteroides sp.]|nr:trimeric intracellular cation channel family protein [Bacteroides sp.]
MDAEATFLFITEVIGTIAAAISGIRMAAAKHFDWFGAYTVGLMTAIGGGTVRDVLLDIPVFWMQTWWYLAVTGLALIVVILFRNVLVKTRILFIFDSIGLALFVVIGIQKTIAIDYPFWVAIVMGITTGAIGGVIRDILLNNEPLLFQKDIYATACLAGGLVYWLLYALGASPMAQGLACAATVIIIRILAVKYGWSLPVLVNDIKAEEDD